MHYYFFALEATLHLHNNVILLHVTSMSWQPGIFSSTFISGFLFTFYTAAMRQFVWHDALFLSNTTMSSMPYASHCSTNLPNSLCGIEYSLFRFSIVRHSETCPHHSNSTSMSPGVCGQRYAQVQTVSHLKRGIHRVTPLKPQHWSLRTSFRLRLNYGYTIRLFA
jgi:hypothetical protein